MKYLAIFQEAVDFWNMLMRTEIFIIMTSKNFAKLLQQEIVKEEIMETPEFLEIRQKYWREWSITKVAWDDLISSYSKHMLITWKFNDNMVLAPLFNGISALVDYSMPKTSL